MNHYRSAAKKTIGSVMGPTVWLTRATSDLGAVVVGQADCSLFSPRLRVPPALHAPQHPYKNVAVCSPVTAPEPDAERDAILVCPGGQAASFFVWAAADSCSTLHADYIVHTGRYCRTCARCTSDYDTVCIRTSLTSTFSWFALLDASLRRSIPSSTSPCRTGHSADGHRCVRCYRCHGMRHTGTEHGT